MSNSPIYFLRIKAFNYLLLASIIFVFSCKKDSLKPEEEEIFEIFDCAKCKYIVEGYFNDGVDLDIKPGDVICLQAGIEYGPLLFTNIVGEGGNPVILRNCDGVATVKSDKSFGVKFEDSKNFKVLGDGAETKYGIKISTNEGFFLSMEYFTTDFEIARIEIAGLEPNGLGPNSGFAGMGIKTSPYQDCDLFTDPSRRAWVMQNISVHENYIHDTGGEGLYIGHGFYTGRKESACSQVTYSHSIENIKVYENIIENVGYDGIQIKNADLNVAVYNNIIRNYGNKNENAHNEGLFVGEGCTGEYYNNLIVDGTGNGIQYQGIGDVNIFNNIVVNAGQSGIFAASGEYVFRLEDGYHNIINNTIVNSGNFGITFYNNGGGIKRIYNNVIAGSGNELMPKGATVDSTANILTQNIGQFGFEDFGSGKVKGSNNSPLIDAGINVSEFGISTDYAGQPRPAGAGYDIGAYENQ
ncbi:MAG: hypothetical protein ACI83B_000276 [Sediminicola sp.]|jgi:hypothetical protein